MCTACHEGYILWLFLLTLWGGAIALLVACRKFWLDHCHSCEIKLCATLCTVCKIWLNCMHWSLASHTMVHITHHILRYSIFLHHIELNCSLLFKVKLLSSQSEVKKLIQGRQTHLSHTSPLTTCLQFLLDNLTSVSEHKRFTYRLTE